MDLKFGLFGGGWQDYHDKQIKPVLNHLDQQISDIRLNGIGAQLARMQVMNGIGSGSDATGIFAPKAADTNAQTWASMLGVAGPQGAALQDNSVVAESGRNIATAPSLDDAARSAPFNMRDTDLAATRNRSNIQQGIQMAASKLAGPIVERLLPEEGIIGPIAKLVGKAIDAYDGIHELEEPSEAEKFEQAYQRALFDQLNGLTMQRSLSASTPPAARGFFP